MSDPANQAKPPVDPDAQLADEARDEAEDGIDLASTATSPSPAGADADAEDAVSHARFDELRDQGDHDGPGDLRLEMILDVPVTLTVEVGRTRVSLRELLKLNRGSVVELDQLVTQPMSLLVNDTLVARGEPVMVNERFGIRLTEVVSAEQRIRKLG